MKEKQAVAHSERQEKHAILQVFRFSGQCDECEVADTCANRDAQLVHLDDASERDILGLTTRCFGKQVIVLREHYPPAQ